jgi:hypothetical protein
MRLFVVTARQRPNCQTFKDPRNRFQGSIPGIDSASLCSGPVVGTLNRVVTPARQVGNRFLHGLLKRFTNSGSKYIQYSRLAEPIPWNRFPGSINVYKFEL